MNADEGRGSKGNLLLLYIISVIRKWDLERINEDRLPGHGARKQIKNKIKNDGSDVAWGCV